MYNSILARWSAQNQNSRKNNGSIEQNYMRRGLEEQYPARRKGNKRVVTLWNRFPSKSRRSEIATLQGCRGWLLSIRGACVFPAAVAPFFMPIFLRRHDFRQLYRSPVEAAAHSQAVKGAHTQEGKTKRAWNVQLVFTPINRVYLSGPHLNPAPRARISIWIYYRNNISSVRAQLNQASLISLSTNPGRMRTAPPFPSTPEPWVVECQTKNDVSERRCTLPSLQLW